MFNVILTTLKDGEVVVVVDFQERLTHEHQDEAQGEFFNGVQSVVFPAVAYFRVGDNVWAHSFMVLSDDLEQDSPWVQHTLRIILENELPNVMKRAGAKPMTTVKLFSDNCAGQFKNRYIFFFVGAGGIEGPASKLDGQAVPLVVEWHFWAACHGKNVSDSEGATLKNVVAEREKDGVWRLSTTRDLFSQCVDSQLSYFLRAATDEELDRFYEHNPNRGGHAQIPMTKVRKQELKQGLCG